MEYAFREFQTSGSGFEFCGISVKKSEILFTKSFYAKMGEPEFVKVFIDNAVQAICIKPWKSEDCVYKVRKPSQRISCAIYKEMPQGRYKFKEEVNGGFVCTRTP